MINSDNSENNKTTISSYFNMICVVIYVCDMNSAGRIVVNFTIKKKSFCQKQLLNKCFYLNAIEIVKNNCANKYNLIKLIYKIMTNNKKCFFIKNE